MVAPRYSRKRCTKDSTNCVSTTCHGHGEGWARAQGHSPPCTAPAALLWPPPHWGCPRPLAIPMAQQLLHQPSRAWGSAQRRKQSVAVPPSCPEHRLRACLPPCTAGPGSSPGSHLEAGALPDALPARAHGQGAHEGGHALRVQPALLVHVEDVQLDQLPRGAAPHAEVEPGPAEGGAAPPQPCPGPRLGGMTPAEPPTPLPAPAPLPRHPPLLGTTQSLQSLSDTPGRAQPPRAPSRGTSGTSGSPSPTAPCHQHRTGQSRGPARTSPSESIRTPRPLPAAPSRSRPTGTCCRSHTRCGRSRAASTR